MRLSPARSPWEKEGSVKAIDSLNRIVIPDTPSQSLLLPAESPASYSLGLPRTNPSPDLALRSTSLLLPSSSASTTNPVRSVISNGTGTVPVISNPLAVLANVSLTREGSPADGLTGEHNLPYFTQETHQNNANAYFSKDLYAVKTDANERHWDPVLLGIISEHELSQLVDFYFDYMRGYFFSFFRTLHTAQFLRANSPFLTTALAAAAASFDPRFTHAAAPLAQHAELLSLHVFAAGMKSTEIVQAYCTMLHWAPPAQSSTQEKSWTWFGEALRIATEIRLDIPLSRQELKTYQGIEHLGDTAFTLLSENKTRAMSNCVHAGLAMAIQHGLPHVMMGTSLLVQEVQRPQEQPAPLSTSRHDPDYSHSANRLLSAMFVKSVSYFTHLHTLPDNLRNSGHSLQIINDWQADFARWQQNWPYINNFVKTIYHSRRLSLYALSLPFGDTESILQQCEQAAMSIVDCVLSWDDHLLVYASNFLIIYIAYATTLVLKLSHQSRSQKSEAEQNIIRAKCHTAASTLVQIGAQRANADSIASLHGSRILSHLQDYEQRSRPLQPTMPVVSSTTPLQTYQLAFDFMQNTFEDTQNNQLLFNWDDFLPANFDSGLGIHDV
ncbi:hypothetical protein EMMF5_004403 [Cystobasidiomycetes sp. EMM_F5]